jgi:D-alanyl-lipoteichoic acid acyltransferase DltB (MBOAT superfamily)
VWDFYIGRAIYRGKTHNRKKWLIALSVFLNLGVLFYYKYAYFVVDTINYLAGTQLKVVDYFALLANDISGGNFTVNKIILPVGISFYTFQTISYSVDIYRGKIKPLDRLIDFGFYVTFFPQLVAGPIVRANEFVPQMALKYQLNKQEFGQALVLILQGLLKKMFIGDYIAVNFVDRVFSNPMTYSGFENIMAIFGYSLQVYVDFSGYTDIAIGLALLLGYRLPANFNSPYKAQNVGEFWKRWHISLSTWLKDYLYIPLGGNKHGEFRTNINLMATMLLGGLWHGSSWQFVIWGGLNGIGLVFYKYWKRISPWAKSSHWGAKLYGIALTFLFISFTRIWFRSETMHNANAMLYQISHSLDFSLIPTMIVAYKGVFSIMLLGFIAHWFPSKAKSSYQNWFINSPIWAKLAIVVIAVFAIYQVRTSELQPFIYFQF